MILIANKTKYGQIKTENFIIDQLNYGYENDYCGYINFKMY